MLFQLRAFDLFEQNVCGNKCTFLKTLLTKLTDSRFQRGLFSTNSPPRRAATTNPVPEIFSPGELD